MDAPDITEVTGADAELRQALTAEKLPADDLLEPGRRFFRFSDDQGLIGLIGWETEGDIALLRSLVVPPVRRRRGWGRMLIQWALLRLAEDGVTDVYLLTTSIDRLATTLGFVVIDRTEAPPPIRTSRQYASLCPSTAILMHRSLP